MIKKDAFQNLKCRRIYQFYLDEETGEITDITSRYDFVPVRHGYWRTYKDEHTCSCCDETVTGDWYDEENDPYWFCPWCGAKMDGERKEE